MKSSSWQTGHRGVVCASCEGRLEPGATAVSALFESKNCDGVPFARHDFCATCFDGGVEIGSPFSWWRYEVARPEERKAAFDLDVAREFLLRLLREAVPEHSSLRYLLALLLMRKRIVRVTEQFVDERGEVMCVRLPPDEAIHEMVCPSIDEAEAESLRDQIVRLFDLGDGA